MRVARRVKGSKKSWGKQLMVGLLLFFVWERQRIKRPPSFEKGC